MRIVLEKLFWGAHAIYMVSKKYIYIYIYINIYMYKYMYIYNLYMCIYI